MGLGVAVESVLGHNTHLFTSSANTISGARLMVQRSGCSISVQLQGIVNSLQVGRWLQPVSCCHEQLMLRDVVPLRRL
jgi:hypothetical protein